MTDEHWRAVERWFATRDKHLIDQMTIEQWLAIRKEAGLKIDPATAETCWQYAQTLDPYGSRRTSAGRSGGNTSPALPEVTSGSNSVIYPTAPFEAAKTRRNSTGKRSSSSWVRRGILSPSFPCPCLQHELGYCVIDNYRINFY